MSFFHLTFDSTDNISTFETQRKWCFFVTEYLELKFTLYFSWWTTPSSIRGHTSSGPWDSLLCCGLNLPSCVQSLYCSLLPILPFISLFKSIQVLLYKLDNVVEVSDSKFWSGSRLGYSWLCSGENPGSAWGTICSAGHRTSQGGPFAQEAPFFRDSCSASDAKFLIRPVLYTAPSFQENLFSLHPFRYCLS